MQKHHHLVLALLLCAGAAAPVAASEGEREAPLYPLSVETPAAATAVTRNYPGPAPCGFTLQACITGSSEGDTIVIAPGTYVTPTISVGKAVSLVGGGATPAAVKLRSSTSRMFLYQNVPLTATMVISNLMVENGNATTQDGGALRVSSGKPPLIHTVVMSNNTAPSNGGALRVDTVVPVTVVNSLVLSNAAGNNGGGISVAGDLILIDTRVEQNAAGQNGGGVFASRLVTISGSTVQSNTAANLGGGLALGLGGLITATRILSNAAAAGGGVQSSGSIALANTSVLGNAALGSDGGGIYSTQAITLTLLGTSPPATISVIANNRAAANGGGIYASSAVLELAGQTQLESNQAIAGEGGGAWVASVGSAPGSNVRVKSNTAATGGGGLRAIGDVNLNDGLIQFNSAGAGDGGGILANGNVTMTRGRSEQNDARNGGGIFAAGDILVQDAVLVFNSAADSGGCAFSRRSFTARSSDLVLCDAGATGGGASALLTVTLANPGSFGDHDNRAGRAGGLAYANAIVISNVAVFSNSAPLGGALAATATVVIDRATVQSNTARFMGGAVSVFGTAALSGSIAITGSLLAANVVTGANGLGGAIQITGTALVTAARFERNTGVAGTSAGGAYAGGPITVTDSSFLSNTAGAGGGIVTPLALIAGAVFTGNKAVTAGAGALQADRAAVTGNRFLTNTSVDFGQNAGGILAGDLVLADSVFEGNSGRGAAVSISRTGAISNSVFTGQCASGACSGSAIRVNGPGSAPPTTVYSSTFDRNGSHTAGASGGAIGADLAPLAVRSSRFTNNRSEMGGAILANTLALADSDFTGNSAFGSIFSEGGAIMGAQMDITRTTFYSNSTETLGGAVSAIANLRLADARFVANTVEAGGRGGAIGMQAGSNVNAAVNGSVFERNRVKGQTDGGGGAVFFSAGKLSISDASFTGNQAPDAGALECVSACEIRNTAFVANRADRPNGFTLANDGEGGAIRAGAGLTVTRSRFLRNEAGLGGAISYRGSGGFSAQNSLFAENRASNPFSGTLGHALYMTGSVNGGTFFFNTVVSDALAAGTALAIMSGTVSVMDNIFARQGVAVEHGAGGTVLENFNLFSGNSLNLSGTIGSGGGSFTGTPVFLNPAIDLYYLLPVSPGIDQGTDAFIYEDVDGQARPRGAGFDIGFDEGGPRTAVLPIVLR